VHGFDFREVIRKYSDYALKSTNITLKNRTLSVKKLCHLNKGPRGLLFYEKRFFIAII
jgi:hypothetical protein